MLAAEANGRSRIVLDLDQQLPYQTHVSGNDIVVLVGAASVAQHGQGERCVAPPCSDPRWRRGRQHECTRRSRASIFVAARPAAGRLIVRLTDPRTPIDLKQQGSQILVDFSRHRAAEER